MTFKMTITQTQADGAQTKVAIENSQAFTNQKDLFNFLDPVLRVQRFLEPLDFSDLDFGGVLGPPASAVTESPFSAPKVHKAPEETKPVKDESAVDKIFTHVTKATPFSVSPELTISKLKMAEPKESDEPKVFTMADLLDEEQTKGLLNLTPVKPESKAPPTAKQPICEMHCPECGLRTSKVVLPKSKYTVCKNCNTRLYMHQLGAERGEPNEQGVAFRANKIFTSYEERQARRAGEEEQNDFQ